MNNLVCYYAIKDHKMRGYLSYLELKLENLVATWLVILKNLVIIRQIAVFLHPRCILPMAINQSPQEHAYSTMGADLDLC